MSETTMHFTASAQLAIQFMLGEVLDPNTTWPTPHWFNFVWFTDIKSGNIRVMGDRDEDPRAERIERVITFCHAGHPVAQLTMEGIRFKEAYHGCKFPAWRVAEVSYLLKAEPKGVEGERYERKLIVGSYSGLSTATLPEG